MVLATLKKYNAIIQSYQINLFEQAGHSLKLRLQIKFINDSWLHVRETVIDGTKQKYAYHWQDRAGQLLIRWDNADHWDNETAPHHKHVGNQDNVVASYERTLEQVLKIITEKIASESDEITNDNGQMTN